ncbi:MAG: putative ABC transport system permease protein [Ilumatobacter sp.]
MTASVDSGERNNAQSQDLDAFTKNDAADETPGVRQVQQSFFLISLLYGLVAPCVTGLFFLIVTFQKSGVLTLPRAIGALRPGVATESGGIPLRFETTAVIFWAAALLVLGAASALVSARGALAIDPIEATTVGGNR